MQVVLGKRKDMPCIEYFAVWRGDVEGANLVLCDGMSIHAGRLVIAPYSGSPISRVH